MKSVSLKEKAMGLPIHFGNPVRMSHTLKPHVASFLGVLLIISWNFLLSIYTLELQHSCQPLIGQPACATCTKANRSERSWHHTNLFIKEGTLSQCSENNGSTKPDPDSGRTPSNGGSDKPDKLGDTSPIIEPQTIIEASVVGSAVAVGAVIIGAPAVVAIGAGVLIWLAASALLSSGS